MSDRDGWSQIFIDYGLVDSIEEFQRLGQDQFENAKNYIQQMQNEFSAVDDNKIQYIDESFLDINIQEPPIEERIKKIKIKTKNKNIF